MTPHLFDLKFENIKSVFFDFDGVLVDSVDIKTRAFQKVFSPYGKKAAELITNYHLQNGGIDRYRKIEHVLRLLNQTTSEKTVNHLANQFASEVKKRVCDAPLREGVEDLLKNLKVSSIPLFIVSGTPQGELTDIVEARNLKNYFKEVCGSPETKTGILGRLLKEYSISSQQALFIGDACTDMEAAQSHQIFFLGVPPSGNEF